MNQPILSICIPTYNRSDCLRQCLDSIVKQFEGNSSLLEKVEITISNNGSTDNTDDVVSEYVALYKNIHYSKNEKNLGFDRNIIKAVEMSSGEYCLTLGDDDGLFSDGLQLILNKIETLKVPYLMLNSWGYDHYLEKPITANPNRILKDDVVYNNLQEFVVSIDNYIDLVGSFGGMSVQLFKRSDWISFKEKDKYLDTQAIHLFILVSAFKNLPFAIVAQPVVKTRNDNMRWDICPGFETNAKRSESTIKIALWMSDLYNLNLSEKKLRAYFMRHVYIQSLKDVVKKTLHRLGLRHK